MKILRTFLLSLCVLGIGFSCLGLAGAYSASQNPTLVYDGSAHTLTVLHADDTDLFPDFKDLMPGDTRTQEITLKAQQLDGDATLWLKAEDGDDTAQRLQHVTLSIYAGDRLVASGSAAGNDALQRGVELYQFHQDQSVALRVQLTVSTQAGNELAGTQQPLQWIFTVQDTSGSNPIPPQTGDSSQPMLWWLLLFVSLAGVVGIWAVRRRDLPRT